MVWGQIAGAVIGGVMANKAAKKQANAQNYATEMQMRGYTDARPYIQDMYKGGTDALKAKLGAGYYGGPTYAGMNDMQTNALDGQYNFGNSAVGAGQGFMNAAGGFGNNYANLYNQANATNLNSTASDLYNKAAGNDMFAGNANDIYNKASGGFYDQEARNLFNQAGQDSMGNAQNYALNNSQGLVDAAMRGANRNLNEVQLTNLDNSASGTGNTNNSRAGVAEAILRDRNSELEAATTAQINDQLMGRSLSQGNQDFANQMNALGGMKSGSQAQINAMSGALADKRFGNQAQFNNMNTGFGAMNTANNNTFNNMMAANQGLQNTYGMGFDQVNAGYGSMLGAGGAYQKDTQNQYTDAQNRFEGERDFASNAYGDYNAQILGRAPQSAGTVTPNFIDPTAAAMSGAMAGFGAGGKYGQQIGNMFNGFGFGRGNAAPQMQYINAPAYQGMGFTRGR